MTKRNDADVSHPSPRADAEDGEIEVWGCTGASSCSAKKHEHGCYADTGQCSAPSEHATPVSPAPVGDIDAPGTAAGYVKGATA